MSLEILDQHLVDTIGSGWIAASVSHGTSTAVQILPHHHGYFPETGVGSCGAGRDHAVVEELVVEGVGPAGWAILVDRHRGVVGEVSVPQHFKHVVSSDLFMGMGRYFILKQGSAFFLYFNTITL